MINSKLSVTIIVTLFFNLFILPKTNYCMNGLILKCALSRWKDVFHDVVLFKVNFLELDFFFFVQICI